MKNCENSLMIKNIINEYIFHGDKIFQTKKNIVYDIHFQLSQTLNEKY